MPHAVTVSYAWLLIAHAIAAALLGALEVARLGDGRLALVVVPLFALTGLVAGAVIAVAELGAERLRHRRCGGGLAALAIALPSLLVTVPVCATLFDGAYARTLPLAGVLPFALPIAAWFAVALAVAIGRKLASGDLIARVFPILACAAMIGAAAWAKRKLGSGYLDAQLATTLTAIVAAGVLVRLVRRARVPWLATAIACALVVGTGAAALREGLAVERDRKLVTASGGHSRDLVRLWRVVFDRDGDGSSTALGGGDCDDGDVAIYPNAVDTPGDGIDQDCDGEDAVAIAAPAPQPARIDEVAFRWSLEPSVLLERTRGMNVLVITIDALRFDAVAPDALHRDDFPNLVKLLDESVYFTRAIAPATSTDVSLCSAATGRLDPFQSVGVTLGEAMRASGRQTTAVMPHEALRHVGEVLLGRGVELRRVRTDTVKEDVGDVISAPATAAEITKAIAATRGKPFFAWAHFFDAHEHHQIGQIPRDLVESVHADTEHVRRYRATVLAVDRAVGELLRELVQRRINTSTIVVLASDHGESLKEDPRFLDTHGLVAYGPLVRIPIAFRIPGVAPGRRVDPISMVDLAPTLLALIGSPGTMGKLDGFDLTAALLDGPPELRPPPDRAIVTHEERQWSVVEWPYHLVATPRDNVTELYDLSADPAERFDLSSRLPEVIRRLRTHYARAPRVRIDRTWSGRAWREQQAQPPRHR